MAIFGIAIFLVGYKDLSIGRVATVVALCAGSGVFAFLARRRSH